MKNNEALSNFFFDFVKNNASSDPVKLLLSKSTDMQPDLYRFAVMQIECRQKTSRKLSKFIEIDKFIFPSLLSAEQATHQSVAAYHSSLVEPGQRVIDITAGLGIDAFTISRRCADVTAVELDPQRYDALVWNKQVLGLDNLRLISGDSLEWIRNHMDETHYDVLFADPARRNDSGGRTYFLHDCLPDVVANYKLLSGFADKIIIKASPIVDVTSVMKDMENVKEIHVVCVRGECKEILVVCDNTRITDDPQIIVVDLDDRANSESGIHTLFSMAYSERGAVVNDQIIYMITPGQYLYDPNSGIHKVNCAGKLCRCFPGLRRVSANTDLYVSDELYRDFPGRVFYINRILSKNEIRDLRGERRDVAVRNYPLTAEQLRNKLKISSSDDRYIYGCRVGLKAKPELLDVSKI